MPLGDGHFIGHRNGDCLGEDLIGDADMHCLSIQVPQRHDAQAVIGRFHINLGARKIAQDAGHRDIGIPNVIAELLAIGIGRVVIFQIAMQEGGMCRVDPDFQGL